MGRKIKVNLEGISSFGGGVEAGKWLAELVEVAPEEESQKGNPMIIWTWKVLEGPSEGGTIKSYTVTESDNDNALISLRQHGEALGLVVDDEFEMDEDKVLGMRAYIFVGKQKGRDRETGEEREFSRVNRVEAAEKRGSNGSGRKSSARSGGRRSSSDSNDLPF